MLRILGTISLGTILSCAKMKANKLEGVYECTVFSYSYFMGEYSDTTFQVDLVIDAENDVLRVNLWDDFLAPVKLFNKQNCYYEGSSQSWQEICFSDGNVEYTAGYQYHNSSGLTTYSGIKKQ